MNVRTRAVELVGERHQLENPPPTEHRESPVASENFGIYAFSRSIMQRMLPPKVYTNVVRAMEGREKIQAKYADVIAGAMKDWAVGHGATHFTHWFQPLTGTSASKHDAFIDWHSNDLVMEKFDGKQLLQGEPDASSFPHGGLRSTFEARGYTGWDPSSPAFVWKSGRSTTLFVPSVYFSWNGEALDHKLPFLRSEEKLSTAVLRLLQMTGIQAETVHTTLGFEQEYFLVDRALGDLRPDLLIAGRTLFGAPSAKGQQLQDHYFGSVKERVISFMHDFEQAALELGIPVKTRHNEVAPAQHEVAPVYERASKAIDHNILLMDVMNETAIHHNLACLLHEKPFAGLNGSGKHVNWSLTTDTGINLLNPTDTPENTSHFLILLTAVLSAMHQHGALMRASVGSAANDLRLGGHEAPPAIISVYLGQVLERLLEEIEHDREAHSEGAPPGFDFGHLVIPELPRDNTDRNRTSPFAFTGNKFEFRALGSSANPSFSVTVLNTIVAESLHRLLDEIEQHLKEAEQQNDGMLHRAILPVIRKEVKRTKDIRFSGDNYSGEWTEEAKKRRLPNLANSLDAYSAITSEETVRAFEGVLTPEELHSRQEILVDTYAHRIDIEAHLMVELFHTHILPAATAHQSHLSQSIMNIREALGAQASIDKQLTNLAQLNQLIEQGLEKAHVLQSVLDQIQGLTLQERAVSCREQVHPLANELRRVVDAIELLVDDDLWNLPKYRELLFVL